MSVARCKREHTYQDYLAWQQYLDEQYNEPSRTDYYLMQIACVLVNLFSGKNAKRLSIGDFLLKLRWKPKRRKPTTMTLEQRTAQSKAAWFAITGYKKDK